MKYSAHKYITFAPSPKAIDKVMLITFLNVSQICQLCQIFLIGIKSFSYFIKYFRYAHIYKIFIYARSDIRDWNPRESVTCVIGLITAEEGQHKDTATASGYNNVTKYEDTDDAFCYGYSQNNRCS